MVVWKEKWIAASNKKRVSLPLSLFNAFFLQQIETACGNGQLTPEDYIQILNRQLVKDQALLAHLKQAGDNAKVAIVSDRISTIRTELTEMQE